MDGTLRQTLALKGWRNHLWDPRSENLLHHVSWLFVIFHAQTWLATQIGPSCRIDLLSGALLLLVAHSRVIFALCCAAFVGLLHELQSTAPIGTLLGLNFLICYTYCTFRQNISWFAFSTWVILVFLYNFSMFLGELALYASLGGSVSDWSDIVARGVWQCVISSALFLGAYQKRFQSHMLKDAL